MNKIRSKKVTLYTINTEEFMKYFKVEGLISDIKMGNIMQLGKENPLSIDVTVEEEIKWYQKKH